MCPCKSISLKGVTERTVLEGHRICMAGEFSLSDSWNYRVGLSMEMELFKLCVKSRQIAICYNRQ
jgi:hypothetical protein